MGAIPILSERLKAVGLTLIKTIVAEEAWGSLCLIQSRPFPKPETGKIAVKVINHYGDEVLKVYEV